MSQAQIQASPEEDVLYEVSEHIATITINREAVQNTISGAMLDRVTELFLQADRDRDVRCIIFTGTGRFFCAGLDLRSGKVGDSDAGNSTNLDLRSTPPTVMHNLDTPVICALNGSAAGYGMDMALGCDIRIMAEEAKMAAALRLAALSRNPGAPGSSPPFGLVQGRGTHLHGTHPHRGGIA